MSVNTPVYLDYAATCPVDERVLEEMLPFFRGQFGNAASRTHAFGWAAEEAVEQARATIAATINADPKEIVFTSGATESNNLAVKGVSEYASAKGKHVITLVTEHKALLDSCKALERRGFEVSYMAVGSDGRVDLEALATTIRADTVLVSIMAANNETGVMQDIAAIGALCHERGVVFHTDAVQAYGKVPLDVKAMNVDLMSLSAHKIYGPKGVGALYVRRRRPRIRLTPQIHGGGHERGNRSGTLNVPGIVGFAAAARICHEEMAAESSRITGLREHLIARLLKEVPKSQLNGHRDERIPGTVNISFSYVEGESLLMGLKELAISSGSACTSASLEPSYVLRSMGLDDELAHSSLRISIGRQTTREEVDYVVDRIRDTVERLREMSPLWEMVQEGIDLSTIEWAAH